MEWVDKPKHAMQRKDKSKDKVKYELPKQWKQEKSKYEDKPIFEVPCINFNEQHDGNIWAFIATDILSNEGILTKTMVKRRQAMERLQKKLKFMDVIFVNIKLLIIYNFE